MCGRSVLCFLLLAVLSAPALLSSRKNDPPQHTRHRRHQARQFANKINLSAQGPAGSRYSTPDFDASLFSPEMAHLIDAAAPCGGCPGATAVPGCGAMRTGMGSRLVFFFSIGPDLTASSTAAY
jgi:hypothetical protein